MAVFEKSTEIIVEELGKGTIRSNSWIYIRRFPRTDSLDLFQVISEIEDALT